MTGLITWIISGLAAGWLARAALGAERDYGLAGDLVLGTLGAVVGGWLFRHSQALAPPGAVGHALVGLVGAVALIGGLRVARSLVMSAAPVLQPLHRGEGNLTSRVLKLIDTNQAFDAQRTFGERVADRVAAFGGSWTFIGVFVTGMVIWMVANQESARPFDPFPFILLNLLLSCLAALQAPVIMMSQNRQALKDRLDARSDYEVNVQAAAEIEALHAKCDRIEAALLRLAPAPEDTARP